MRGAAYSDIQWNKFKVLNHSFALMSAFTKLRGRDTLRLSGCITAHLHSLQAADMYQIIQLVTGQMPVVHVCKAEWE